MALLRSIEMSHTTEALYLRGTTKARVEEAIVKVMDKAGFERLAYAEDAGVRPVRRLLLRRSGAWLCFADEKSDDRMKGLLAPPVIDAWGRVLSQILSRSVLVVWTWDGEASLRATRYKRGKVRGNLSLLDQLYRDSKGQVRAPAKVFWPWLPRGERAQILGDGIAMDYAASSTGDPELDNLIAGFRDDLGDDPGDGESIYVGLDTSIPALANAIALRRPFISHPFDHAKPRDDLLFAKRR
jgi:hypothetical protein